MRTIIRQTFNFNVYSYLVRPIEPEGFYNSARSEITFLNPVFLSDKNISSIKVDIADNRDFKNSLEEDISMDTLSTNYQLSSLQAEKRYWLRARLNLPQSEWSKPYSFFNEGVDFNWYFNHSFNLSDIQFENVAFDSTDMNLETYSIRKLT